MRVLLVMLSLSWLLAGVALPDGGCSTKPTATPCGGSTFPVDGPCPDIPPTPTTLPEEPVPDEAPAD